jgi:nitrite reductase (NO-forming)
MRKLFLSIVIACLLVVLGATVSAQSADVSFILRTQIGGTPVMAFVGVGGEIDGISNPDLVVQLGQTVHITVINSDPVLHDMKIDAYAVTTGELTAAGQTGEFTFVASQAGIFPYYCSAPGHMQAGMVGNLIVVDPNVTPEPTAEPAANIVRNPAEVPPTVGDREATTLEVTLDMLEVEGQLADGTTYHYWTFGGQVPGPMLRVRVGDTVNMTITNDASSINVHSIDLHAVTGPGGGAVFTQTHPGAHTSFTFQALNPGLYVYHCATPSVATHISNGMYGLILVEPEGGLPPVDREYYIMQGELYTQQPFGTAGTLDFSYEDLLNEQADYVVFNGAANALTTDTNALRANVGETVRLYVGVGGPNYVSSFHVIGEIFDRVYDQASLTSAPLTDVQTTLIPPGGATMVEFAVEVPGRYILVDHALSRLERGLAGFLYVEGEANTAIFDGTETAGSGH